MASEPDAKEASKGYRTTDNNFVLRSLIDKQRQAGQRPRGWGGASPCFVAFKKAFDTVLHALV